MQNIKHFNAAVTPPWPVQVDEKGVETSPVLVLLHSRQVVSPVPTGKITNVNVAERIQTESEQKLAYGNKQVSYGSNVGFR